MFKGNNHGKGDLAKSHKWRKNMGTEKGYASKVSSTIPRLRLVFKLSKIQGWIFIKGGRM